MSNNKPQYYSLPLKRALNMMTDADRSMKLYAENVKALVDKHKLENWDGSPIPDYMDAYLNAKVLKDFLQKRFEEPDEKVTEYLKKNNIEGLLMTRDELSMLHTLFNNFEETKAYVSKLYGFSTLLN